MIMPSLSRLSAFTISVLPLPEYCNQYYFKLIFIKNSEYIVLAVKHNYTFIQQRLSLIARDLNHCIHIQTEINVYKAGNTKIVRNAAISTPPITTVARGFWTSAPSPLLTAKGTPPMKLPLRSSILISVWFCYL